MENENTLKAKFAAGDLTARSEEMSITDLKDQMRVLRKARRSASAEAETDIDNQLAGLRERLHAAGGSDLE